VIFCRENVMPMYLRRKRMKRKTVLRRKEGTDWPGNVRKC
jgi:hypothetical protein